MTRESDETPPVQPSLHKWRSGPAVVAPGFVAVGRITGIWRDTNRLVVESLTDFEERFRPGQRLWVLGRPFSVKFGDSRGRRLLIALDGVDSADEAVKMSGLFLEVPEEETHPLEPDTYYEDQIVGLRVLTENERYLGRIVDVLHTGSNDVYVVEDGGPQLLLPAIDDVIKSIDVAQGTMTVDLLEGLAPPQRSDT